MGPYKGFRYFGLHYWQFPKFWAINLLGLRLEYWNDNFN